MKKRYEAPLTEVIEIEMEGMLCASGVDGGMDGDADGAALARENEAWMQWALLGIVLDDD